MLVKLKKRYKNHPKGTELDVSPRVKTHLESLKVLERSGKKKKASKKRPSKKVVKEETKALESAPLDRMIGESLETK